MKKLSSMLALGLALALTFGMTVCAAESPTTEGTVEITEAVREQYAEKSEAMAERVGTITVTGAESTPVTTEPVAPETLYQAETIAADRAAAVVQVPSGATVTTQVVGSADIQLPADYVIPATGISLNIPIAGVEAGKTYVLLHLANGTWETIVPTSVANGVLTATFTSLSPVVANEVIIVTAEEEEKDDDDDAAVETAVTATGVAASPKTAETLPAAGVVAVICLAGAAVCAGKVRYNK